VPLILFAGFGAVIFFLATAYILGREYFEFAAMRFRSPPAAKLQRKRNATMVFLGGLLIAGFVSIPIVNLVTPLKANPAIDTIAPIPLAKNFRLRRARGVEIAIGASTGTKSERAPVILP
jgi:hypothetical protein